MDEDIRRIDSLAPVPVDLEELADALEGDPLWSGGVLDLDTGEVWPQSVLDSLTDSERSELLEEKIENPLGIDNLGSRAAYQDMCDFIEELDDHHLAELLDVAVRGPGAFRRFKDVLGNRFADLDAYYSFTNARKIERAVAWLADNGYAAGPAVTRPE